MLMSNELPDRQQRFVDEYLLDLNATRAAIRAGYSPKTAAQYGHQLLQKTSVRAAIARATAARSERTRIGADAVVQELARLGFSDLGMFLAFDETGVTLKSSDRVDTRCLKKLKEKRDEDGAATIQLEVHDKVAALKLLGEHLGIFRARRAAVEGDEDHPGGIAVGLTDEERGIRIATLLEAAGARRAGRGRSPSSGRPQRRDRPLTG
jgi:phage terminase small subunit